MASVEKTVPTKVVGAELSAELIFVFASKNYTLAKARS
jgi:hypothetical protein